MAPRLVLDKLAWVHVERRRLLVTRNHDRTLYYVPGGRREPGETDEQALVREIDEELGVAVLASTMRHFRTYDVDAPGAAVARMTCYFAEHRGEFRPDNEIAEFAWVRRDDRERLGPIDQLVLDDLHAAGHLD
jgi:8-oxo-dGTP pyrophosphatase MutT (NUDIX family)